MDKPSEIEKLTSGDFAYRTTKAALATIPFAGSVISELFETIIEEPVQKRRIEWLEGIYKGLTTLEEKVASFSVERLGENEEFVSIFMTASQIAQRNHQREKLSTLKYAVLNSANGINIEEDMKFMYLSFIDDMTVTELKIIEVCGAPMAFADKHNLHTSVYEKNNIILDSAFPERVKKKNIYDLFAKNLNAKGLLKVEYLTLAGTSSDNPMKVTTKLGDEFFNFIQNPLL